MDWALEAGCDASVAALRAAATARRYASVGRGAAAPLQTSCEFFYQKTDEEMDVELEKIGEAARAAARERKERNTLQPGEVMEPIKFKMKKKDAPKDV